MLTSINNERKLFVIIHSMWHTFPLSFVFYFKFESLRNFLFFLQFIYNVSIKKKLEWDSSFVFYISVTWRRVKKKKINLVVGWEWYEKR